MLHVMSCDVRCVVKCGDAMWNDGGTALGNMEMLNVVVEYLCETV